MREVETVQPLAHLPTFSRKVNTTGWCNNTLKLKV